MRCRLKISKLRLNDNAQVPRPTLRCLLCEDPCHHRPPIQTRWTDWIMRTSSNNIIRPRHRPCLLSRVHLPLPLQTRHLPIPSPRLIPSPPLHRIYTPTILTKTHRTTLPHLLYRSSARASRSPRVRSPLRHQSNDGYCGHRNVLSIRRTMLGRTIGGARSRLVIG